MSADSAQPAASVEPVAYGDGIFAIDAEYLRAGVAAIHLIVEKGRAAFFDTGCNSSLPNALATLERLGLGADNVDYVIPSHVHLDHAGGAGAMMQAFANARLVVHPRGARHMADPARLVEGTVGVYGREATRRLYGDVLPVDPARIIEATHELEIDLAGRRLLCLDTPGHARHHIAVVDGKTGHIFTGDSFGISYRQLDTGGRQFIFLTATPVQFEPEAMHASIDLLASYRPHAAYLTHFGRITDIPAHATALHRLVDAHAAIALREKDAGAERLTRIRAGLSDLLLDEVRRFGCPLAEPEILDIFANDLDLNAQGLEVWLGRL